jgi:hypothetical protein
VRISFCAASVAGHGGAVLRLSHCHGQPQL